MEHDEALERIEIAAAEPEGLERLMAGDTADAAAVAGHLAGCAACTAELARIRRTAAVAREVVRTQADPELRERTLAFVRAEGVPRGRRRDGRRDRGSGRGVADPVVEPSPATAPASRPRLRRSTTLAGGVPRAGCGPRSRCWRPRSSSPSAAASSPIDRCRPRRPPPSTIRRRRSRCSRRRPGRPSRSSAEPDAERVALATTDGGAAAGTLLFSPSTGELVAVASGLVPEPDGMEYGCWIEVDGTRTRIGKMYWAATCGHGPDRSTASRTCPRARRSACRSGRSAAAATRRRS